MMQKVDFLVDWLEFTYLCPENAGGLDVWENFMSEFPEFESHQDEFVLANKGRHGYTHCFMFCDEYTVLYNPEVQGMGVHVTFPSHGLWRLCEMFGIKSDLSDYVSFQSILSILKERSCRITRLDICYDDYDKILTPHDFGSWMMNGQIISRSREWSFVSSTQNGGAGSTFYLGKRGSDRFLRVYDKDYESEGRIPAIRYEFELRKNYLEMIVNKVTNGIKFTFVDLLKAMLIVVNEYEKSGDSNTDGTRKQRAGLLPEWEQFLEQLFVKHALLHSEVELKLDTKKREVSFQRIHKWITRQVLPSLYIIKECLGIEKLDDMISASTCRLSDLQLKMLEKYKEETSSMD